MVQLGFDNTYARALAGLYEPVQPAGFRAPELLTFNSALFVALGLPAVVEARAAETFSGNLVPGDAQPLAMAYAGHQFGGFSPLLGDGRALLLGEVVDPRGERWDIHLKGSGRTVFSRGGDGLAPMGPVLREYLVSEAMYHLGVPTTRVLATVKTGETVYRDRPLPGAVLARVARSHLRVGTFELCASRGDVDGLRRLVAYALERHGPALADGDNPAMALLDAVAERQSRLVAAWMSLGFVHGVMNTDNFTISGETLDYGPCAFIDRYDPDAVFSSIDHGGRYAYSNQPGIAQWNLARFAETLLALIDDDTDRAIERAQGALERFAATYRERRLARLRDKLGLTGEAQGDPSLTDDLLAYMRATRRDFTGTFRALAESLRAGTPAFDDADFRAWEARWKARLGADDPRDAAARMDRVNPLYIPRNHQVERVLAAAVEGDMAPFREMMAVLEHPFDAQEGAEAYAEPAPDDAGRYVTFCGT